MILVDIPEGLKSGPICRTLGGADSHELIGAGYMRKARSGYDFHNDYLHYYSISYIISGGGSYTDEHGSTQRLQPGSYFQRFPGCVHSNYIEEGEEWQEIFVDIGPKLAMLLIEMGQLQPSKPCGYVGLDPVLAQTMLDFRIAVEYAEEENLRLLLPQGLGLIQQILVGGRRSACDEDQAMVQLACRILGGGWQSQLDVESLCREHGWGYERFRKIFRASVGIPPTQYRIRRRIEEARRLLLAYPDLALKDVAARLGYPTVHEFSAQFSRTVGIPPGRFRRGGVS